MALCFSATHPHCVSWTPSARFGQSSNLSNVNCKKSLVFRCRKQARCSLQIQCPPMKAGVASSSMDTADAHIKDDNNNTFSTLRELCQGHVPEHVINRMEEIGYVVPTEVQRQALPVLLAGRDCILHAQTGSGKTLVYLLQIFSAIDTQRFGVQALIVLPTRELGIQVTEVARKLAAKASQAGPQQKPCTVMALLDGGTLTRHKKWLKDHCQKNSCLGIVLIVGALRRHFVQLFQSLHIFPYHVAFYGVTKNWNVKARQLKLTQLDLILDETCFCDITLAEMLPQMQAEPPTIVIATLRSLCLMLEKQIFGLGAMQVLVIDEVDFMFHSSKQVDALRRLLTSYSSSSNRQTIFASASVPQHKRFLHDCIQHKWTKGDVVHVHINPVQPMPSCLHHRFVVCGKRERHSTLLLLLQSDAPQSAIIFVGEQSEKSKKAGNAPPTTLLFDFLKASFLGCSRIILLEEDMNFNQRAASLIDVKGRGDYLLVATDIAARGVDLPETTHIYNFDLPRDAVNYLHRAGRTVS